MNIEPFRFKADIYGIENTVEIRADNPVPVLNDDDKILGFAVVGPDALGNAIAQIAIDPNTPERLELETFAKPFWLDGALEFRGFTPFGGRFRATVVYVKALRITKTETAGRRPLLWAARDE